MDQALGKQKKIGLVVHDNTTAKDWSPSGAGSFARVTVDAVHRSRELAAALAGLQVEWLEMAKHPRCD